MSYIRATHRPILLRQTNKLVRARSTASQAERVDAASRLALDALLAEFASLREEMASIRHEGEQTYAYLLAAGGAVLASQLLTSTNAGSQTNLTVSYLAAAGLALWFPVRNISAFIQMTVVATYLRDVLAPKVNRLLSATSQYAATVGAVRSAMNWEEFHPRFRGRRIGIFTPLSILAAGLLYVPTGLLLWLSISSQSRLTTLETLCLGLDAALLMLVVVAHVWVHVSFRMGLGPYGPWNDAPSP